MTDKIVLLKIKELIAGKILPFHEKSVSIDTLALALNIKLTDLLVHLVALEDAGSIEVVMPKPNVNKTVAVSKGVIKLTAAVPTDV